MCCATLPLDKCGGVRSYRLDSFLIPCLHQSNTAPAACMLQSAFSLAATFNGEGRTPIRIGFHDVTNDIIRPVFAHSAAHVLGLSLEREYGDGLLLADGPPVNEGIHSLKHCRLLSSM